MSPHHARLSLVMLPSPQPVSSVGQGLCWLCMHRPHEDVVGLEWCMGMPPLVHFLTLCLFWVMSRRNMPVSSVGQGLCWLCMHRPHEDVVGEWCMGMPPLVHFLDIMSLLGYVSPTCASLPCHASFAAASEFGWARVVLAVHAPAA